MKRWLLFSTIAVFLPLLTTGCSEDPLVRHKRQTDFFDGVPDLPAIALLCEDNMEIMFNDYYEQRLAEASAVSIEDEQIQATSGKASSHPPFKEKNCQGCHDFNQKSMFIAPLHRLCEVCHVDFVQGHYVHGPVAVRDCLVCHLPHESQNKSLLRDTPSGICNKCHQEDRQVEQMHELVMEHRMDCVNCHDAHGGDKQYFLK